MNLGDKIMLELPESYGRSIGENRVDKVNSGEYIIAGILHSLNKNGIYNMVVTLVRNGINSPITKSNPVQLEKI